MSFTQDQYVYLCTYQCQIVRLFLSFLYHTCIQIYIRHHHISQGTLYHTCHA